MHLLARAYLICLAGLAGMPSSSAAAEGHGPVDSWTWVTVGVADLDEALSLWTAALGFEVAGSHAGPDPGLERFWGLASGRIARQALLRTAGQEAGMLHLVEFREAGAPVRDGAEVFDLCPKNLDIYTDDLPRRMRELQAAGWVFRNSAYSEVTAPNGVRFREIHLPAHDGLNIVLLQLLDSSPAIPATGYAGVGPLIAIVADAAAEKAFHREVLGLELLSDNRLDGPEIERMIGLPPGAALDVSIWGRAGRPMGQVEVIEYQGTSGADRYPRAVPGARGILQITYRAAGLDPVRLRLEAAGVPYTDGMLEAALLGSARVLSFATPAGLRIDVMAAD